MAGISLLRKNILSKILWLSRGRNKAYCQKINQLHKRSSMLENMIKDRDKRKSWHFEILQNHARAKNVFEKVSRPHKRQTVLNTLLVQNITDVLSTGDAAPEILGCGVEITGVKVSPCCQMVNVYWQLPPSKFSSDEDVALVLNRNASKIRAELVSRNVLGRVPRIYFVRDSTNSYVAAFEKAMKEIDLGDDKESTVVPDDSFLENMFEFRESRVERVKKNPETSKESLKVLADTDNEDRQEVQSTSQEVQSSSQEVHSASQEVQSASQEVQSTSQDVQNTFKKFSMPQKVKDMKSDIFGLDHERLMSQVLASKTKPKFSQSSNLILTTIGDANADLFSKIPGTSFYEDINREELLKKFHISRKKLRNPKASYASDNDLNFADSFEEECETEPIVDEEDFFEEETPDRF